MYKLRDYQKESVKAGLELIESGKNGLIVLPTGTGKSLVIAQIVIRSGLKAIVLQPTKEILEQNLEKTRNFGIEDIGVFSASMGEKSVGRITFGTIGTVIKQSERFGDFQLIIVDEADLVNSKGGQYEKFITGLNLPVIGLTATPYRMRNYRNRNGHAVAESRILTRTRPRIFDTIKHIVQISDMFERGYLCGVKYKCSAGYRSEAIESNSTGQGYDEESLRKYNSEHRVVEKIVKQVSESESKHILIFTHFKTESAEVIDRLARIGIECAEISGETKKKDRELLLKRFKSGDVRCVVNVGVLTVGFDFPALDCVIIGRPTKSIRLFYQMCGRGLRPHPGKRFCEIVDICDNVERFGKIETFEIVDSSPSGNELWRLRSNVGFLTGINLEDGKDLERKQTEIPTGSKPENTEITFGKYKGKKLKDLDAGYLKWCVGKFDPGKWRLLFEKELARRSV